MTVTPAANQARGASPRILLLALLPIGDTLFTLPTIRALRARYPAAHLTALVHTTTAPLLRCVSDLDEVIVLPFAGDWRGVRPLARTLRRLRARRFDVAIDFTTPAYKWISFACGIRLRTYMTFDPLWWLLPGEHRPWRATHAAEHYYNCARELDLPPWSTAGHAPELVLPREAHEAARSFLRDAGVEMGGPPLVALHAGGAGLGGLKRWPPERFAALAGRLHEEWGARIVLLGGPEEAALARTVAAAMRTPAIMAAGAVPLLTSVALIAAAGLFVGNDSGLLHAAAAVGTPFAGLFGPTCPANFQPLARRPGQGIVVQPSPPCRSPMAFVGGAPIWSRPCCRGTCRALAALTVDEVLEQMAILLRE